MLDNTIGQIGFWLAQLDVESPVDDISETAFVFDGPQFFAALISGVLLAFGFQLLLTNLGVATGISLAGGSKSKSSQQSDRSQSGGNTIRKIGIALGIGTLISVTVTLFLAVYFATELSLLPTAGLGAILGLTIWATYFTILVVISSTTVGSLVGSLVNTATSGFQALFGTATAAIGAKAASHQTVQTVEAAAAAVRREIVEDIDPDTVREQVEDYIRALRPPEMDWQAVRRDMEAMLRDDPSLREIAGDEALRDIDRRTFADLIKERTDLSPREVDRLAVQMEMAWQNTVSGLPPKRQPMSELVDYLRSASARELLGTDLDRKLDAFLEELRLRREGEEQRHQSQQSQQSQQQGGGGGSLAASNLLSSGLDSLKGVVLGRSDLSDLDAEEIISRLMNARTRLEVEGDKLTTRLLGTQPKKDSLFRTEIENFLSNAHPWELKPQALEQGFRQRIQDPAADPGLTVRELESLSRSDFVQWLGHKGLLTQDEIKSRADLLEGIRKEVLDTARSEIEREQEAFMLAAATDYIRTTPKQDFTAEKIQRDFKDLIDDPDASPEQLQQRFAKLDRPFFERLLYERRDLNVEETAQALLHLEQTRDRVLRQSYDNASEAEKVADSQWRNLQAYLRDTGKEELDPQQIEQELRLMMDDPQAGMSVMRARAAQFNRDTLKQLLAQRRDISEAQAEAIVSRVESVWTRVRYGPGKLVGKTREQYELTKESLYDYLRSTGKEQLNPDAIEREIRLLLNDPQAGSQAIRRRLAMMDRDTLVKLLSQRGDLSEAEVNRTIDRTLDTLRQLANAPRRLALRTQEQLRDFQTSLEDYLRSTDREALNPEGIKRDVKLLVNDPRAGSQSLKERLEMMDRETLVRLLSQRQDVNREDVERIIDQILGVKDEMLFQLKKVQMAIQNAIERVFARIRNYLDSLERPELNYEGIRDDLHVLFDDPQAGFEALKLRLSQVNRDTLVAVLSSRDDMSPEDADRLIGRVESVRDRVLQRAERLQHRVEEKVEQVKQQAQHQVEETRKAAAAAAWWLFATALVSALASAAAGALAVNS